MVFLTICAVIAFILLIKYISGLFFGEDEKINLDGYEEGWFGRGLKKGQNEMDASIRPFKIVVPEEVLMDLKGRLDRTRLEDPIEDTQFQYGFNPDYLQEVVVYWKSHYDWRKWEERINEFPHFKTCIEGLDVHFMHLKPVSSGDHSLKIIPLLLLNGWPSCFYEFYKMVPLLTTPRPDCNFVFEIICPSIPGFGFSESSHQKGFDARAAARIFIVLMERIGINRFYVHGGDWGSLIAKKMAQYYSSRVKGLHMTMCPFAPYSFWNRLKLLFAAIIPSLVPVEEYKIVYPLRKKFLLYLKEGGYFHMQATKPYTIGCGMSDSPAGLAAYILQLFSSGTNHTWTSLRDGGLTQNFTLDELLTIVTIYWINNNFTSSSRFYMEVSESKEKSFQMEVRVPSALAVFPHDIFMLPRTMTSDHLKNLISYNIMPRGGHFAPLEEPQLLSDDLWQFIKTVEANFC